jgi:hypothetical protein
MTKPFVRIIRGLQGPQHLELVDHLGSDDKCQILSLVDSELWTDFCAESQYLLCYRELLESFVRELNRDWREDDPNIIVVDGYFVDVWEISPFYEYARVKGHTVEVTTVVDDLNVMMREGFKYFRPQWLLNDYSRLISTELPSHWCQRICGGSEG